MLNSKTQTKKKHQQIFKKPAHIHVPRAFEQIGSGTFSQCFTNTIVPGTFTTSYEVYIKNACENSNRQTANLDAQLPS